ncbi:MAG: DUF1501 domain-containing protein [Steroidobacteraceae bacterium]
MQLIDRRQFLGAGLAAAALASSPRAAFTQMAGSGAPFADFRALVCVFLFGGNDSFNMVVPRSQAEYDVYANARQNLAVPLDQLLPINPATTDGAAYGFHPAMAGMQQLFEQGRLAVVANVGPLIVPATRDQVLNNSVPLPPQLFSHNDQQDQWHTLKGNDQASTGWAGRVADLLAPQIQQQLPTNLSLFGTSLALAGNSTLPFTMGPSGPVPILGLGDTGIFLEQRRVFDALVDHDYESIYARAFGAVQRRTVDLAGTIGDAIAQAPPVTTVFPGTPLGAQLGTVARLIAARAQLQTTRQVFFVASGGFDTHDNQAVDQPQLLGNISACLSAFNDAMQELNVAGNVTTFTQSDFGRTLTSNGDGTDHGWGGVQMVVGDSVLGGDIYGRMPVLEIDGPDDVSGGRMIPTTSADQYVATLARWFGVADAQLAEVAPHIGNFAQQDLGFLPG